MKYFKVQTLLFMLCSFYLRLFYSNDIPKFVPQGYYLELFPDVNASLLKGYISINIATYAEPSNVIHLDADPAILIHYKSIKVTEFFKDGKTRKNGTIFQVKAVERVLFESGELKIHLSQKLQRDITYRVDISFQSSLKNDSSEPFFMRTFFDSNTHTKRKFVIMDLTKTGCYKAFPCFNKPDFKSWISLTVVRRSNFYALSTAPVNFTTNFTPDGVLVRDHFLNTPPMSMNSLALIVSDYKMIEKYDPNPDLAQTDDISRNTFNSDTVNLIIRRLEDILGIHFPLPSFHVVMVPHEANIPYINAFGLLIFNATTSFMNYPQLMELIHGACFQWFVHVATPVSENISIQPIILHFKNLVAKEVTKNLKMSLMNEFDYEQLTFINLLQTLTSNLLTCKNIEITYETLALNMLDKVFPNLLSESMHLLLRKKEFKMYTEKEIWNYLNDVMKQRNNFKSNSNFDDLKYVFDSWKKNEPIPLVTVKREYYTSRINISQEAFIYTSYRYDLFKLQKNVTKWLPRTIPIVVSQPKNFFIDDELIGWLSHKNYIFELKSDHYDFIVVNPSHLGPFVVNYDQRNWNMLVENFNSLPSGIQLQLLADSLSLANVGLLDYSIFLNMSTALIPDEQHLPLWIAYFKLVFNAYHKFHGQVATKYKKFLLRQINTLFTNIPKRSLEKYSIHTQNMIKGIKHRINCINDRTSCFTSFEYENMMHEAKTRKRLTGAHTCEIVRNISLFDWQIIANGLFHALYNFSSTERAKILSVLSCSEHPPAFETYMNLLFLNFNRSDLAITENDQKHVIDHVAYYQRHMLLNFIYKNFNTLKERLSKDVWITLIDRLIKITRSAEDLNKLIEFCNKYAGQFGTAEETAKEGLVAVSTEINWESEIFPSVENLLNDALKNYRSSFHRGE